MDKREDLLNVGDICWASYTRGVILGRLARLKGIPKAGYETWPAFLLEVQAIQTHDIGGGEDDYRAELYWLHSGWMDAHNETPMWRPPQ